ncbi:hypothetical protein ACIA49_33345 [Kribbella sp. NPDC051587]|uniref:hypothetical protein n=1 Tax=Kribbella sp. NPDC051587 TaxID=3364119 RepID=UPI00379C130C
MRIDWDAFFHSLWVTSLEFAGSEDLIAVLDATRAETLADGDPAQKLPRPGRAMDRALQGRAVVGWDQR